MVKQVAWYAWADDDEFADKAQSAEWCERLRDMLWRYGGWSMDRADELGVTPVHVEALGFAPDMAEEFAYLWASREFERQYSVPDSVVALSPKEESLFRWAVAVGLPLG